MELLNIKGYEVSYELETGELGTASFLANRNGEIEVYECSMNLNNEELRELESQILEDVDWDSVFNDMDIADSEAKYEFDRC